jgi:hypothetical protein
MSVVLEVEILAEECGVIDTYASIETETEVFEVPISAAVLSEAQFQEWQDEGGNLPCNVTSVDQTPKKQVRSRAPAVATLKKQLAEKRTQGEGRAVSPSGMGRDLQDPVPEPEVPSTEIDWFVDWGKNVSGSPHSIHGSCVRTRARVLPCSHACNGSCFVCLVLCLLVLVSRWV